MNLTEHFTLEELTATQVRGLSNRPDDRAIANLTSLAENILEPIRLHFVAPVVIHSGYRSPKVNEAVKGSATSQHLRGNAADFHVIGIDFFTVARYIAASLDFDQLILEYCHPSGHGSGWVHCSYVGNRLMRREILQYTNVRGATVRRKLLATEIPRAA